MTLSEIGEKYGWSDDQLVAYAKEKLGMAEEDARFMLAIERSEVDSDVIDEE